MLSYDAVRYYFMVAAVNDYSVTRVSVCEPVKWKLCRESNLWLIAVQNRQVHSTARSLVHHCGTGSILSA